MKYTALSALSGIVLLSFFSQSQAAERKNTISLGYVYTNVSGSVNDVYKSGNVGFGSDIADSFNWQDGANLKYRYELNEEWGGMLSATGTSRKSSGNDASRELKYRSFMAGPTLRFNEYLSTYVLVGMAKGEYSVNDEKHQVSKNKTGFSSGLGIQINPIDALAIDIGYEFAHLNYGDNVSGKYNSLILGVGYHF